MVNQWLEANYNNLKEWAKNAAQQNGDWEDLLHYTILTILEHPKSAEIVKKGHMRWWAVRIMLNSSRGKKSEYYRLYRPQWQTIADVDIEDSEEYDTDIDLVTEWIHGILEDMKMGDVEDWYRAQIFELCAEQERLNFSQLSREINIPRTSISNAYYEAIELIKQKLLKYGNDYPHVGNSIRGYLDSCN